MDTIILYHFPQFEGETDGFRGIPKIYGQF